MMAISDDDGASWREGPLLEQCGDKKGSPSQEECTYPCIVEMGEGLRVGYTVSGQGLKLASLMHAFQEMEAP